ncbi:hypothetical protein ACU3L3_07440 [Priestia endophytica]
MNTFKTGDKIKFVYGGVSYIGEIVSDRSGAYQVNVDGENPFLFDKYNLDEYRITKVNSSEQTGKKASAEGTFEQMGTKLGQLVDSKQMAYGDSFSKAFKLMQVFLEDYKNEDSTYTIPESLLKHILIQVRIIDKQNRIFSNPEADLMDESPYGDMGGYSLLGKREQEKNK